MQTAKFLDEAPAGQTLTAYDRAHLKTYVRLLDAEAEGADWQDVVAVIFGLDPRAEPDRANRVHASHLARAKWLARSGYRDLLR